MERAIRLYSLILGPEVSVPGFLLTTVWVHAPSPMSARAVALALVAFEQFLADMHGLKR